MLIVTLRTIPKSLLSEISPRSTCTKRTAKLPMFFLLACAGIIAGITSVNFKLSGQLAYGDNYKENMGM